MMMVTKKFFSFVYFLKRENSYNIFRTHTVLVIGLTDCMCYLLRCKVCEGRTCIHISMSWVLLLSPHYGWGNWGSGRWTNLPRFIYSRVECWFFLVKVKHLVCKRNHQGPCPLYSLSPHPSCQAEWQALCCVNLSHPAFLYVNAAFSLSVVSCLALRSPGSCPLALWGLSKYSFFLLPFTAPSHPPELIAHSRCSRFSFVCCMRQGNWLLPTGVKDPPGLLRICQMNKGWGQ